MVRVVEGDFPQILPTCELPWIQLMTSISIILLTFFFTKTLELFLRYYVFMFVQERNVPANIMISCREISRIKQISEKEVMKETYKNARSLFTRLK